MFGAKPAPAENHQYSDSRFLTSDSFQNDNCNQFDKTNPKSMRQCMLEIYARLSRSIPVPGGTQNEPKPTVFHTENKDRINMNWKLRNEPILYLNLWNLRNLWFRLFYQTNPNSTGA
jgi:hypothetical protein